MINRRIVDGYVLSWDEFQFEVGSLEAIVLLSEIAPRLVVVTNQQCVGKGLITSAGLAEIHARMTNVIRAAGGRIDEILVCAHLESDFCDCRKPRAGLAANWLSEHPEIDGSRSVMVGDSNTDMEMAANLAAITGSCWAVAIGSAVTTASAAERHGTLYEFAASRRGR